MTTHEVVEWKSEITMLLVKAVVIGGVAIASLAGAEDEKIFVD